MRQLARAIAVLATATLLGGCSGGDGGTASAGTAPPSASPSCEDPRELNFIWHRSALGLDSGGVYVLTVAAGPAQLCVPKKIFLTTYRAKGSDMNMAATKTETVGEYGGTKPLSIVFPVLGTPCLAAVFHTGSPPDGQGLFLEKFTGTPAMADGKLPGIIAGVSTTNGADALKCT